LAQTAPREERRRSGAARIDEPLTGLVVLAIDNEPRVLGGLSALLEKWGCRVIAAASLAESLAALERDGAQPDAIVADYHLDESDGIAVVAALRENFGKALPAILITAERSTDALTRAASHDIRVLAKPLKPAALRALLSQWRVVEIAVE